MPQFRLNAKGTSHPFLQSKMWSLKLRSLSMITPKYLVQLKIFFGNPLLVKKRWRICFLVCLEEIIIMFVLLRLTDSLFTLHQK